MVLTDKDISCHHCEVTYIYSLLVEDLDSRPTGSLLEEDPLHLLFYLSSLIHSSTVHLLLSSPLLSKPQMKDMQGLERTTARERGNGEREWTILTSLLERLGFRTQNKAFAV